MKNTITLLVTILIVASGMSSCGAVLIKRQHGPGYYVNKNPGMPTAHSDRSDNKHIKPATTRAENPTEEESEFPVNEQMELESQPNETVTQLATNTQPEFTSEESSIQTDRSAGVENDEVEQTKPSLYEWSSSTRLAEKMKMSVSDDQSAQAGSAANESGG